MISKYRLYRGLGWGNHKQWRQKTMREQCTEMLSKAVMTIWWEMMVSNRQAGIQLISRVAFCIYKVRSMPKIANGSLEYGLQMSYVLSIKMLLIAHRPLHSPPHKNRFTFKQEDYYVTFWNEGQARIPYSQGEASQPKLIFNSHYVKQFPYSSI